MRTLQAAIREQPGLIVVVERDAAAPPSHQDAWRLFLWDWNVPHHAFDDFATREDAVAYAAREFLIDAADWEECDAPGSPETIANAIRRLYPRPLTPAEAAAATLLACGFEFIDRKGRPIFPGDERCITSSNVVADLMESLDWADGEGLVASVYRTAHDVVKQPEFQQMWAAFTIEAGISGWRRSGEERPKPVLHLPDEGPLLKAVRDVIADDASPGYQTGYLCASLGLCAGRQALPRAGGCSVDIIEDGTDSRTIEVIAVDGWAHVLLHRRLPDGRVTTYCTAVDGELRSAVTRASEQSPVEPVPIDRARPEFAEERDSWMAWGAAGEPPDALSPRESLDIGEVQRMLMVATASDAGLVQAVEFLRAHGISIAETMNGALPHVVRPLVVAALQDCLSRRRENTGNP